MALPSDQEIQGFLTRTIHDADDLALLSRTALKDRLTQHFKLSDANRARLDDEEHYKQSIRAWIKEAIATRDASGASSSSKTPEVVEKDAENEDKEIDSGFSSLEDDEPTKKRKGKARTSSGSASGVKKPRTSSSSASSKSGKAKGRASGGPSVSADEATLKRLKGFVLLCGTRKPWKNLFAEQGCGKDDEELGDDEAAKRKQYKRQIEVVKGVLADIGMTTPYSKAKAQKIKEDKEFKQELEAIQQAGTTERSATRSRRSAKSAASAIVDTDSESEDEGPVGGKPKAFTNSLAAFAAELNDSD